MNFLSFITFLSLTVSFLECTDICYDKYGCFSDDDFYLPEDPNKVNTRFFLFNAANDNLPEQIQPGSFASFRGDIPTKMIIHGFKGNTSKSWIHEMKDELKKQANVNIILVDWSGGNDHPYTKSVGNTQIVGTDIANLILNLVAETKTKTEDFHLIGYSLGAHVSGIAGLKVPNLGRITGLDPSSLYYSEKSEKIKLDLTDADFVDVIHTDGSKKLGMGTRDRMGHADFYPNGGKDQPGCERANVKVFTAAWAWLFGTDKEAKEKFSCSHRSSRRLFTDSISNKCKYTSFPCQGHDEFKDGYCVKCSTEKGCNHMGYWASKANDLGKLYLNTGSLAEVDGDSYCLGHYQIRMVSNDLEGQSKARGKFKIFWKTASYVVPTVLIEDETITLKPNRETKFLMTVEPRFTGGEIEEVYVSYKRTSNYMHKYFYDQYWSIKFVEILEGGTQRLVRFCPRVEMIKSGTSGIFVKCE